MAINSNFEIETFMRITCFDSERYAVWYQMNTDFEGSKPKKYNCGVAAAVAPDMQNFGFIN